MQAERFPRQATGFAVNDKPLYQSHEADKWFDRYIQAIKERDELKARCDRYVEALKWYADHAGPISEWMDDMGSRAKQALEGQ